MIDKPNTSIPDEFKGYFWDCDFAILNVKKYRQFILGRLLQYGGFQAMKWILKNFSIQEVKQYLDERGKKTLDSRSFEFWSKCVKIEEIW